MSPDHPGGLTREHVVWGYRLLLDRDPESEDVIGPKLAGSRTTAELRHHLITSAEFREKNPDFAHTNDSTIVIKEIAPGVRLFIDLSDHAIGLNILRGQYEQTRSASCAGCQRATRSTSAGTSASSPCRWRRPSDLRTLSAFEPPDANANLPSDGLPKTVSVTSASARRGRRGVRHRDAHLPVETLNSGGAHWPRMIAPRPAIGSSEVPLVALDSLICSGPCGSSRWTSRGRAPQVLQGAARVRETTGR
jgi:hypothetical protein